MQKPISLRALLSIVTGRLLCDFSTMHAAAEHIIGHPIWTHEFADRLLNAHLKDLIVEQYPELDCNADEVTGDNWSTWIAAKEEALGNSRMIGQGAEVRHQSPVETLREIMPHAKVVVVSMPPTDQ